MLPGCALHSCSLKSCTELRSALPRLQVCVDDAFGERLVGGFLDRCLSSVFLIANRKMPQPALRFLVDDAETVPLAAKMVCNAAPTERSAHDFQTASSLSMLKASIARTDQCGPSLLTLHRSVCALLCVLPLDATASLCVPAFAHCSVRLAYQVLHCPRCSDP